MDVVERGWIGVVLVGLLGALVPAGAAAAPDVEVVVTRDVEIPVSSGNVLRGDLYQPRVGGEVLEGLPTVVTYFPYVKDDPSRFERTGMHRFAREGYAALLVDIAGTGVSPGEFGFLSEREIADGHDLVEWAAQQPFSDGRVGMWGYSYPGLTAAHVAATRPPSLRAVVPASIFHDPYRDLIFPGGILTLQDGAALLPVIMLMTLARQRQDTDPQLAAEALFDSVTTPGGLATLLEAPTHTTYDDYWKQRALEDVIGQVEVPTLFYGGWNDLYPRGTLLLHQDVGAAHKRLVVGPAGHLAGAQGPSLDLMLDETVAWFDTFLRQDPTPAEAAAASGGARIFDLDPAGQERLFGRWSGSFVDLETWPTPTVTQRFELCAGGPGPSLTAPWPVQGELVETCDTAGSLPVLPVPVDVTGGENTVSTDALEGITAPWQDLDQRVSLGSTALLTPPFEEDVVLTGAMELALTATTLGVDADWIVRVVDVGPDGARVIAPGWLRASRRHEDPDRPYLWHTHDRTELVTPGVPYELRVEIWPSSYRIPAGHQLGVLVRTADTTVVTPSVGAVISTIATGDGASSLSVPVRSVGGRDVGGGGGDRGRGGRPDGDPRGRQGDAPGRQGDAPGRQGRPGGPGAGAAQVAASSTAAAAPLPVTGGGAGSAGVALLLAAALVASAARAAERRPAAIRGDRG